MLQDNTEYNSLSKHTHIISLRPSSNDKYLPPDTFNIPYAQNVERIAIMPVNEESSFVYWTLTDRLLKTKLHKLNYDSEDLIIRLLEIEQNCKKEIYSFRTRERVGKLYVKAYTAFKPIVAEAGVLKDGEFVSFLESTANSTISYKTIETEYEIWMKKTKDTCETFRFQGNENSNDITHISAETGLERYYKYATRLHKNPLSSKTLFKLPS
ncbi:MAG: DUF4912 domain-containing protein [Planctomycetes bacterium]|nr:DUF4912 domain-containing protein [Planctomycetota bacterium]